MAAEERALGFKKLNPGPLDEWYGPYDTVAAAKLAVPVALRTDGRTVGIRATGGIEEWWWKNGTTDNDLVLKATSGNVTTDSTLSSTSANPVQNQAVTNEINSVKTAYTTKDAEIEAEVATKADMIPTAPKEIPIVSNAATYYYTDTINPVFNLPNSVTVNVTVANFPDGGYAELTFNQGTGGGANVKLLVSGLEFTYQGGEQALTSTALAMDILILRRKLGLISVEYKLNFKKPAAPPPPPPPTGGFTAQQIIDVFKADGAIVDDVVLTEEYGKLTDYAKANATMIFSPPAHKSGVVYAFNRTNGAALPMTFARSTVGAFMTKGNYYDLADANFPRFQWVDDYHSIVQKDIDQIKLSTNTGRANIVEYLPVPYVTDGSVDYTSYIQTAWGTGGKVDFVYPGFPIQVNANLLKAKSNTRHFMEPGGGLWLKPGLSTSSERQTILQVRGMTNVKFYNFVIRGDWNYGGTGSLASEIGQGWGVYGSSNVEFYNCVGFNTWGDCFYAGVHQGVSCSGIKMWYCVGLNGGRDCTSFVAATDSSLYHCLMKGATKANPLCGFNAEANRGNKLDNIYTYYLTTADNLWTGVQLGFTNLYKDGDLVKPVNFYMYNHFNRGSAHQTWLSFDKIEATTGQGGDGQNRHLKGGITFINPNWNNPIQWTAAPNNTTSPGSPPGNKHWPVGLPEADQIYAVIRETVNDEQMKITIRKPTMMIDNAVVSTTDLTTVFNDIAGGLQQTQYEFVI